MKTAHGHVLVTLHALTKLDSLLELLLQSFLATLAEKAGVPLSQFIGTGTMARIHLCNVDCSRLAFSP